MKILVILSAVFGIQLVTFAVDNEGISQYQPIENVHSNRFYFGLEYLAYQLNIHVQDIKVYGTRFFWGIRFGYDYIKPNTFYGGFDLLSTSATVDFHAKKHGHNVSWHHADRGFGNLEVRFGYTLAPGRWLTTPFAGLGMYNVFIMDHHNHQGFEENLPYITAGVISKYAFTRVFNIGINGKILRTMGADQHFKFHEGKAKTHDNMWGGAIGVPFIWHVGSAKQWDITLEPYFLKLDFSDVQNVYGAKVLFGYSW